jgi:hypothetical protein
VVPLSEEQVQALAIVQDNLDFFSTPLLDQERFQVWLNKSNHKELCGRLSDKLMSIILGDEGRIKHITVADYCDALKGKTLDPEDEKNSLMQGNSQRMIKLLENLPGLSQAIIAFQTEGLIGAWRYDNPKDSVMQRPDVGLIPSSESLNKDDLINARLQGAPQAQVSPPPQLPLDKVQSELMNKYDRMWKASELMLNGSGLQIERKDILENFTSRLASFLEVQGQSMESMKLFLESRHGRLEEASNYYQANLKKNTAQTDTGSPSEEEVVNTREKHQVMKTQIQLAQRKYQHEEIENPSCLKPK